jgi:hypothetical protein
MGSCNGHQAWDLSMATKHGIFHWPPSMGSSIDHQAWIHLHLLLLFKRQAWIIGGLSFLPPRSFWCNLEYLFHKLLEEGKNDEC